MSATLNKSDITRPRKVALYLYHSGNTTPWLTVDEVKFTKYDEHYQALPDGEEREQTRSNMTRVSEPVDVTFASLPENTVVAGMVESLNAAERQAIEEFNKKIAEIRSQKAQLLALTHQPDEVAP